MANESPTRAAISLRRAHLHGSRAESLGHPALVDRLRARADIGRVAIGTRALGINSCGDVVGTYGSIAAGTGHGFLLVRDDAECDDD